MINKINFEDMSRNGRSTQEQAYTAGQAAAMNAALMRARLIAQNNAALAHNNAALNAAGLAPTTPWLRNQPHQQDARRTEFQESVSALQQAVAAAFVPGMTPEAPPIPQQHNPEVLAAVYQQATGGAAPASPAVPQRTPQTLTAIYQQAAAPAAPAVPQRTQQTLTTIYQQAAAPAAPPVPQRTQQTLTAIYQQAAAGAAPAPRAPPALPQHTQQALAALQQAATSFAPHGSPQILQAPQAPQITQIPQITQAPQAPQPVIELPPEKLVHEFRADAPAENPKRVVAVGFFRDPQGNAWAASLHPRPAPSVNGDITQETTRQPSVSRRQRRAAKQQEIIEISSDEEESQGQPTMQSPSATRETIVPTQEPGTPPLPDTGTLEPRHSPIRKSTASSPLRVPRTTMARYKPDLYDPRAEENRTKRLQTLAVATAVNPATTLNRIPTNFVDNKVGYEGIIRKQPRAPKRPSIDCKTKSSREAGKRAKGEQSTPNQDQKTKQQQPSKRSRVSTPETVNLNKKHQRLSDYDSSVGETANAAAVMEKTQQEPPGRDSAVVEPAANFVEKKQQEPPRRDSAPGVPAAKVMEKTQVPHSSPTASKLDDSPEVLKVIAGPSSQESSHLSNGSSRNISLATGYIKGFLSGAVNRNDQDKAVQSTVDKILMSATGYSSKTAPPSLPFPPQEVTLDLEQVDEVALEIVQERQKIVAETVRRVYTELKAQHEAINQANERDHGTRRKEEKEEEDLAAKNTKAAKTLIEMEANHKAEVEQLKKKIMELEEAGRKARDASAEEKVTHTKSLETMMKSSILALRMIRKNEKQ